MGVRKGHAPIPTALRLVTATRDKHGKITKDRYKHRPQPKPGIPSPPSELSELARAEWDSLIGPLYTLGVMTKYDKAIFSLYCQAWGTWQAMQPIIAEKGHVIETKQGNIVQNPALGISNVAARDCAKYAIELGLTPSARSRIDTRGLNARAAEETDDFAEFVG